MIHVDFFGLFESQNPLIFGSQRAKHDRVLRFFVWHLQGFGSIPHMIPLSNSKFALVFESFNKFLKITIFDRFSRILRVILAQGPC